MLYGVDVHARYQSGLDIARLKSEGYSFLVTKASEGTSIPSVEGFTSAQFKARYLSWLDTTRAQGMIPGLYHWLRAGRGAEQARFFYGLVVEAGGPQGMLIQLDCEDDAGYADVVAWRDEWNRLTGGHPFLLYTGGWWWRPRGWDGLAITPYLWDSHYLTADADTIPDDHAAFAARIPPDWWTPGYGNWPGATILQFTSRRDAGLLGNNIDLNVFRGTVEQLKAMIEGDDMATILEWVDPRVEATTHMFDKIRFGPEAGKPVELVQAINKLVAAAAADETRDAATLAAVKALAEAGGADAAPIVAAINAQAEATRALVEQRHQEEMAVLRREYDAEVAGLRAELERLATTSGS